RLAVARVRARQHVDALREGADLELDLADGDHRAGLEPRLFDLGAVEERAVRRGEIAQEIAAPIAHDLAVRARHGLVGEHQLVVLRLADPEEVALDDLLAAALVAGEDHERAARQLEHARVADVRGARRVGHEPSNATRTSPSAGAVTCPASRRSAPPRSTRRIETS